MVPVAVYLKPLLVGVAQLFKSEKFLQQGNTLGTNTGVAIFRKSYSDVGAVFDLLHQQFIWLPTGGKQAMELVDL